MNALDLISQWSSPILLAVQGVFIWVVWTLKRSFVPHGDHAVLCARMDTVEHRLDQVPGPDQIQEIRLLISEMAGNLRVMEEREAGLRELMNSIHRGLTRIENHHMETRR